MDHILAKKKNSEKFSGIIGLIAVFLFVCLQVSHGYSFAAESSKEQSRPKIGLVLSGGGARGSAHIGVIKVLEEMGIHIKTANQTLEAVAASPEEAEILNVEPGFPLMLIQRRGFDAEGQAVEFSKDLVRGDCSRFVSNLEL